MDNQLKLTDDEFSLILTSLHMTILNHKKYVEIKGEKGLDFQTKEAIRGMEKLHKKSVNEHC